MLYHQLRPFVFCMISMTLTTIEDFQKSQDDQVVRWDVCSTLCQMPYWMLTTDTNILITIKCFKQTMLNSYCINCNCLLSNWHFLVMLLHKAISFLEGISIARRYQSTCLSLYGLHVLNRDVNMNKRNETNLPFVPMIMKPSSSDLPPDLVYPYTEYLPWGINFYKFTWLHDFCQ